MWLGSEDSAQWVVVRWAIAAVTGIIVVIGVALASSPGPGSYGPQEIFVTAVALVPAAVLGLRVRTPRYIVISGSILLGLTLAAWGIFFIGRKADAFAGVYILPAWFLTLVATGCAATLDERKVN